MIFQAVDGVVPVGAHNPEDVESMGTEASNFHFVASLFVGVTLATSALATGAFAQDDARYACLEFGQVEAIHQLNLSQMLLEVEGGTSIYLLTVDDRCFSGGRNNTLSIQGSGEDACIRTTDTVHYGRRECGIQSFQLIETQDQLDQVLATN